jgi:hypothetical protein
MLGREIMANVAGAILIAVVWAIWAPLGLFLAILLLLGLVVRPVLYRRWLNSQDPRSRELVKASHGAGILALSGSIVFLAQSQGAAVSSLPLLVTSGLQTRLYGPQGPLDTVILVRSTVKVGIGVALAHFIPFQPAQLLAVLPRVADSPAVLFALLCIAGWFIAWWCLATGAAKILLLLVARIRRRGRKTPPPMNNPRGDARNANRAEARAAMRGQGGMTSKLDEREF